MVIVYRIRHAWDGRPCLTSDDVDPSCLNAPNVIRDGLDDMVSPIDGKPQTSKRAYYRQLRQAGCEVNPEATIRDQNRPELDTSGIAGEVARALRDAKVK